MISGHDVAVDVLPDPGASLHDVRVAASNLAWGVRNLGPSVVTDGVDYCAWSLAGRP